MTEASARLLRAALLESGGFNPFRDQVGRFASGPGAGSGASSGEPASHVANAAQASVESHVTSILAAGQTLLGKGKGEGTPDSDGITGLRGRGDVAHTNHRDGTVTFVDRTAKQWVRGRPTEQQLKAMHPGSRSDVVAHQSKHSKPAASELRWQKEGDDYVGLDGRAIIVSKVRINPSHGSGEKPRIGSVLWLDGKYNALPPKASFGHAEGVMAKKYGWKR